MTRIVDLGPSKDPMYAANPEDQARLISRMTPSGQIIVRCSDQPELPWIPAPSVDEITLTFSQGSGPGVLHLGAAELDTELGPDLAFWRSLGRYFVSELCGSLNPTDPSAISIPIPDPDTLAQFLGAVPPMRGAERLSIERLELLWAQMGEAITQRAAEHPSGVQGYLETCHPQWHTAGRVCLHLAEHRADPARPFAFIATYARARPGSSRLQYVPLSRALQEYAGARNTQQLLKLLQPLQRAAEQSAHLRALIEAGDIYHPLAWTAEEAYRFLRETEHFEQAGVVMRVPQWWHSDRRPRPKVSVTLGRSPPAQLGLKSLLDFNMQLTLGDETLTEDEIKVLLEASAGLVLIRGKWVEVDPDTLGAVLERWRVVEALTADGIPFGEAMRMLAGADLKPTAAHEDALPEWSTVVAGQWLQAQLSALRDPKVIDRIEQGAGLNATLRPYQKHGAQWLWTLYNLGLGGCLADDMGLGKTIQVIALLSILHAEKSAADQNHPTHDLLVVPASLVDNWASELRRFAPQLRVLIAHPSKIPSRELKALPTETINAHDAIITTYGTVIRTPWMQARRWRCVILDEAQAIKNPAAKQTRAIKKLSAQWRLALTGTPVENRLSDLWSIFDFLNPGLLGTVKAFNGLCKRMAEQKNDGYAPFRRLVAPYILRRLKTNKRIISDLPDKTEITTHCLLSKPQAALYKQTVDGLKGALEAAEGIQRKGVILASLMRLKQICNHPSQWLGDGVFNPAHSGKFRRLTTICETIAQRQEKLLVFTQFRSMTQPLQEHLATCFGRSGLVLHGGTPVKKRHALVQQFQGDEEIPFMVLSLKAGGTGLNLTAANHVIHFDRWWNPAVENQATDRAYRIGQKRNVLVQKFVCKGTIEERIDALIADKKHLSDEVLSSGAESKLTELSDEALLAWISLDLQSAVVS